MKESPSNFKIFTDAISAKKLKIDEQQFSLFRRANARYRFAKDFECSSGNMAENTIRGYSESLRLFLAHTALEIMQKAIEFPKENDKALYKRVEFVDADSTKQWRKLLNKETKSQAKLVDKMKVFLNKKVSSALQAFADGKKDNLIIVAHAFRIAVAHGYFTATGMKALSQKNAKLFHQLSDSVLEKTQTIFAEWLQKNVGK